MVRRLFSLSAICLMFAAPALGADLPSTRAAAPPPALPIFSWTGFYAGGQAGYGFGNDSATLTGLAPNGIRPAGFTGGAHAGYNYQTGGTIVVGLEGDIEGSAVSASSPVLLGSYNVKSPVQASIRGRAGFAVDRALFYATGGVAFATFNDSYAAAGSASSSRVGYTVGGGVEYAISGTWSVRGEYRYGEFGSFTNTFAVPGVTITHKDNQSRAEVGFSYKFAEPVPPVVAKY